MQNYTGEWKKAKKVKAQPSEVILPVTHFTFVRCNLRLGMPDFHHFMSVPNRKLPVTRCGRSFYLK